MSDTLPHVAREALGPLATYCDDPAVTDVFLNSDGSVWIDRGTGLEREPGIRIPAGHAHEIAVRAIAAGGRHLDDATPVSDVRLGAGLRVHGVLPPISAEAAILSIRIPRSVPLTLEQLAAAGMFSRISVDRLHALVDQRANLLITGAGGTGKTTLLAALVARAGAAERIVVVEDVAELRIPHEHVVRLESRQPNLEGRGGVALDILVRESLRMRPDRVVVGECRGAELRELLIALNTGHDGGAGTVHANSLADVPARLEALGSLAGWSAEVLARQAVSALDAVIHLERDATGRRMVAELGTLRLAPAGHLVAESL